MYCTNCGSKNDDSANYCTKCGHKLQPVAGNPAPADHERLSHWKDFLCAPADIALTEEQQNTYRRLGGWLAVITYGTLVAVIILMIEAVLGGIAIMSLARLAGFGVFFLGLCYIAVYAFFGYYGIKMYRMIKNRDCRFLRFYEVTMLILSGAAIAVAMLGEISPYFPDTSWGYLIQSLLVTAIWEVYFRKSIRVRVYFGSDDYLQQSLLARFL